MELLFSINLSNNRTNFFHVNDDNCSIITSITRFTYSTERSLPVSALLFYSFSETQSYFACNLGWFQ